MTTIRNTIAAALVGIAGLATTTAKAGDSVLFDVDANSTMIVDLTLCGPAVDIEVTGDGDTDLDFFLYNSDGDLIFSDEDLNDQMWITVEQWGSPCQDYELEVLNYGNVYNRFRVVLTEV